MPIYYYEGSVREFDRCINPRWKATTYAPSEKKARVNLTYQYKKSHGKTADTKVVLSGKIIEQKEETA